MSPVENLIPVRQHCNPASGGISQTSRLTTRMLLRGMRDQRVITHWDGKGGGGCAERAFIYFCVRLSGQEDVGPQALWEQ